MGECNINITIALKRTRPHQLRNTQGVDNEEAEGNYGAYHLPVTTRGADDETEIIISSFKKGTVVQI